MALRDKLRLITGLSESPRAIAGAFAIGVFIGMSPLLGLHTVLGLFIAWALGLNKFVTLVGVYITNPWTIVPIYTFATWLGAKVLGISHILPDIDWSNVGFNELLHDLQPVLPSFIAGSTILSIICGVIGYVLIYAAVVRHRRMEKNK